MRRREEMLAVVSVPRCHIPLPDFATIAVSLSHYLCVYNECLSRSAYSRYSIMKINECMTCQPRPMAHRLP